jgi:hypothetical protein
MPYHNERYQEIKSGFFATTTAPPTIMFYGNADPLTRLLGIAPN